MGLQKEQSTAQQPQRAGQGASRRRPRKRGGPPHPPQHPPKQYPTDLQVLHHVLVQHVGEIDHLVALGDQLAREGRALQLRLARARQVVDVLLARLRSRRSETRV